MSIKVSDKHHNVNIIMFCENLEQLIERLKLKGISGFPWAIDGSIE